MLLILAGVTLAALSGENGILTRAADSKEKTEIADIKEDLQRKILEGQVANLGNITEAELEAILTSKGTLSDETKKWANVMLRDVLEVQIAIWRKIVNGEQWHI